MSYEAAKNKAWDELFKTGLAIKQKVSFFGEDFEVNPEDKSVISVLNSVPAKDFTSIIILHYLAVRLRGLPETSNEWLTFRELSGVEGYLDAFKRRVVEPIVKKYGSNPKALFGALKNLPAKKFEGSESGIIVMALPGVPALVKVWGKDAEFEADANVYFDRSILKFFCTEDIVVLAGFVASKI